ncbi:MAG TPA: carboxypeptidase-like regulatory domain-containing protein, partial [Bryobacteraceae bacterium]
MRSIIILVLLAPAVFAQTATLRGLVTDESGALVPGAKVTLVSPDGIGKTAVADGQGRYSFAPLPPGNYTVAATAPDLATPQPAKILLKAGPQTLNLQLKVAST